MQDHSDAVTAVTLHATGDYFVTASMDRTWAFYDVATGTCFTQAGPSFALNTTAVGYDDQHACLCMAGR
jgi:WD40 repeat protein